MQRVSIGRAIVRKPRVFLMDEPLSALDAKLREALRTELKNLQMNLGATFLFVTHDQIEAMSMGDKIGVLNNGHLVQTGTPQEIYNNPKNLRRPLRRLAADEPDRRQARLGPRRHGAANFELPYAGQANGGDRGAAARPSASVRGRPPGSGRPGRGRVHDVENHGVEKIVTLRVGDTMLRATVPARATRHRGSGALLLEPAQGRVVRPGQRRKPQARRCESFQPVRTVARVGP